MNVYIASSWKNRLAVELLTKELRMMGYDVVSFVENENIDYSKPFDFDKWVWSRNGGASFQFDINGAMFSDLVIYIAPSGCDAWAEIGAAFGRNRPILGLWVKGEPSGLMRRMVKWAHSADELLHAARTFMETGMIEFGR